ncbi:unnamed protein product [Pleuronectes platessa]|uniref:Ig-like domain-containing protein n=1 Tax=Pleuronectes platessa TaxID=8262 RepID=A0A9N7YAN8_PLEPL|nr:unnamed protein product [Pleuronectes platessa]
MIQHEARRKEEEAQGLHVMTHVHLLLLLCSSLSSAASASKSLVVSVRSSVLEQLGRETTLPCWLNPPQSAEALEVQWFRNDPLNTPILLYYNKKMYGIQDASYEGRALFGLKDAASGGLAAGDVSLKLLNVGIEDEGDYTCYVSSGQHSDRGSVSLNLTGTGTTPHLSMVWNEENLVNLSCGSEGWYPRPKLQWADHKQILTPKSLEYSKVSSGLVSVHSWVLVPSSSEVSCSVGLSDVDMKEARVRLEIPPPPDKQVVQSAPGLVAALVIFILLFLAALALLGWPYIKKRVFQKKGKSEGNQAEENIKLLPEVEKAALEEAKKHYVDTWTCLKDISILDHTTTMGLYMMTHVHLLLLLCSSLSSAAPASKSLVVSVRSSVLEQLGRETTLPCWLNPPQSAEALEVRWYRNDRFDTPIILYQNRKMSANKDASYVDRASFGLKDAASGGLAAGDVSMKLLNVGIEDEGDYICYVSSDQGYDRGSVSLKVTETGNTPLLSMVWAEQNLVNLSCGSEGWYPRPKLHWADQKQNLTPKSLEYSKVSSGLVSVHSWVLVPSSSEVSCSVGLSDVDMKEARVRLEIPPPPAKQVVQSAPGLVAVLVIFILLFLAALALLGWPYIKKRVFQKKGKSEGNQAEGNKKLLQEVTVEPTALEEAKKHQENMKRLEEVEKAALEEAKKHYVNIELEDKGNPHVTIRAGIIRDKNHPNGKAVTCLTAIRGTPGFTSGDPGTMTILKKIEQGACNDTGNDEGHKSLNLNFF